ncbi:MAG: hypothetical protein KGI50_03085 [Patescibacteria group bacterium]|nr:hypothetical protein [Patescibacteria group bacterium]MDE2438277.1 hypothetical protein [Patescibacteria group bacterium]
MMPQVIVSLHGMHGGVEEWKIREAIFAHLKEVFFIEESDLTVSFEREGEHFRAYRYRSEPMPLIVSIDVTQGYGPLHPGIAEAIVDALTSNTILERDYIIQCVVRESVIFSRFRDSRGVHTTM